MPHAFAIADEQAVRIGEIVAVEEPDVDMIGKGIDICERRILHAAHGAAVVENLLHIASAIFYFFDPFDHDVVQRRIFFRQPLFQRDGLEVFASVAEEVVHDESYQILRAGGNCGRDGSGTPQPRWVCDDARSRVDSHAFAEAASRRRARC